MFLREWLKLKCEVDSNINFSCIYVNLLIDQYFHFTQILHEITQGGALLCILNAIRDGCCGELERGDGNGGSGNGGGLGRRNWGGCETTVGVPV